MLMVLSEVVFFTLNLFHKGKKDVMIDEIVQWAEHEKSVRAVILTGSRAIDTYDELSDYDLALFCTDIDVCTCDDTWLSKIGKVWLCIHEKICIAKKEFPSRLVIFEKGVKVDFSFYPLKALTDVTYELFRSRYRVLLDKEGLIKPTLSLSREGSVSPKPNLEQFVTVVNEFWFEAYHVAVYLQRRDMWSAQYRLSGLQQQFLLKMIEWNELSKRGWTERLPELGKKMQAWVSTSTWDVLCQSFAHLDEEDIWKALEKTMNLFRDLTYQTAAKLGYTYPEEVDKCISKFIHECKGRS